MCRPIRSRRPGIYAAQSRTRRRTADVAVHGDGTDRPTPVSSSTTAGRGPMTVLIAAAVFTAASMAAPAATAAPNLNGSFEAHYPDGTNRWSITSRCESGGCSAHVVSDQGWERDARFSD